MAVTRDDVRAVAELARIEVPAERMDALVAELNGILAHMDVLARVEGREVAASAELIARGMDLALDTGPSVKLEHPPASFAPASRDGFFLVPRLATHGDAGASEADEA